MYELLSEIKLIEDLYDDKTIELLLENKFVFTRKYDMERCEEIVLNDPIDWHLVPFGDPEWKYVLHRMDYCSNLCMHSLKTGDMKYALKAKELIFNFIDKEILEVEETSLRTLDTGIRLIVWDQCIRYFEQLSFINNIEREIINKAIDIQARMLFDKYTKFHDFSNWGLMQTVGVLNAAKHVKVDKEILNLYERKYYSHLKTQFLNDGMQWEQSSVYLIEVATRLLSMTNDKYRTKEYYDCLTRGAKALWAITNVDGKTITLGDGDEIDCRGFIQSVAYLTRNQQLLSIDFGNTLFEETYFEHGDSAYAFFNNKSNSIISNDDNNLEKGRGEANTTDEKLNNVKTNVDCTEKYILDEAGLVTVKTDDHYLSFQNGNLGGGHGHYDNLHINYSYANCKVLVDSGRYSYVDGIETRKYYKDVCAHNGFELQENILEYESAWNQNGSFQYTPIYNKQLNGIEYFEGSIFKAGVFATRKLIYLPNKQLIVIDTCSDLFKINYVLDSSINPKLIRSNEYDLGKSKLVCLNSNAKLEKCYVSPTYNTRIETSKVVVSKDGGVSINAFVGEDTCVTMSTEITYHYKELLGDGDDVLDCIEISDGSEKYLIAHLPTEHGTNNSILNYNGQLVYGSLIVIKCDKDNISNDTISVFKR